MSNNYDAIAELKAWQAVHGQVYQLPDGKQVILKPDELAGYLETHHLRHHAPSYQGSSEEEEQVGIKHS